MKKCPASTFPEMEPCVLAKGHKGLHFSMQSTHKKPWKPRKARTASELRTKAKP